MSEIVRKLAVLQPEMALFAATCVVLAMGLSPSRSIRRLCAPFTAFGLIAALALGLRSPAGDHSAVGAALLPSFLPYTKSMIAGVGLLLLPLLAGTVDRGLEREAQKTGRFEPMRATRGEFYAFFLFSLTGVMLCATADDLIWLFLALELTSLPTYIMVAMSTGRLRSQEAGVKYFFLGALGAAIFLYGFTLIYGATGTTNLPEIRDLIARAGGLNGVALVGYLFAIVGVSFKIAAAPMHFYAPDVYQGAASPVTAYLAFAPKAAGFITLIPLLATLGWTHGDVGGQLPEAIRVTLWVMAAVTMTVGNALALMQTSVKRILAYSSIAHSGYMLVGLIAGPGTSGTAASNGLGAVMFYLLTYGVMNVGVFAAISAVEKRAAGARGANDEPDEVDDISEIRGLARSHPALGWPLAICALSLAGFPPLLGFFAKLLLFTSAFAAGEILLVIVLAVNSAVGVVYYLRLAAAPLLERRDDLTPAPSLAPTRARRLAAVVCAVAVVGMVAVAQPLIVASHAATAVRRPFTAGVAVEDAAQPRDGAPGRSGGGESGEAAPGEPLAAK